MSAMTAAQTPAAQTPAAQTPARAQGSAPLRLLKAELLKLWTTNSWWIFGILTLAFTGLTLVANLFQANSELTYAEEARHQPPPDFGQHVPPGEGGPTAEDIKRMEADYAASIDVAEDPGAQRGQHLHLGSVLRSGVHGDSGRAHRDQRVLPPDRHHHVSHHPSPHPGDPQQARRRGGRWRSASGSRSP